jgi:hypothetical protein
MSSPTVGTPTYRQLNSKTPVNKNSDEFKTHRYPHVVKRSMLC